jgi:hypothetical protein
LDDNSEVKSIIVGHRGKCVWLKRKYFETTENVHELIVDLLFRHCTICIEQVPHDIQQVMMAVTLSRTESSIGVHDQCIVNISGKVCLEKEGGDHESKDKFLGLIIEVEVELELELENTAMASEKCGETMKGTFLVNEIGNLINLVTP